MTVSNIVGKPQINTAAANAKALYQKGEALATLVVKGAQEDAQAEVKRQSARGAMLKSLSYLDKNGHQAFRDQLKAELELISSNVGDESTVSGHSVNYYRVLVSNWRVISAGIQAGVQVLDSGANPRSFDSILMEARALRAAQSAKASDADKVGKNGMRAAGAGRKAKSEKGVTLAQVVQLAEQLSKDDQMQLMAFLAKACKPDTEGDASPAKEEETAEA